VSSCEGKMKSASEEQKRGTPWTLASNEGPTETYPERVETNMIAIRGSRFAHVIRNSTLITRVRSWVTCNTDRFERMIDKCRASQVFTRTLTVPDKRS
jgi:hypothetical protein